MPVVKLNARNISTLPAIAGVRTDYRDQLLPGFFLRVTARGTRSFGIVYTTRAGRLRRCTLGPVGPLRLSQARAQAKGLRGAVAQGEDPQAERMNARRQSLNSTTLAKLVVAFLSSKEAMAWRPKTRQEFERILRVEVVPVLGHLKPDEVSRGHVRALLDRVADRAPVMANRVFEVTRRLYTWALGKDLVETSPCAGLSKPTTEAQRDRVLTEDEIRLVWTACDAELGILAGAFRLMLLTAQRRGEVLSMRWQDIDGTWWTIPADFAKNGRSHRVPLSPQALAILECLREGAKGPWVFRSPAADGPIENPQKAVARLRIRSKVHDLRLHDFRRTAASHMTGMGISRLTVQKLLNHAERDVTAVYDRHSYDPEKRAALNAWGQRLAEIVRGGPAGTAQGPLTPAGYNPATRTMGEGMSPTLAKTL
jgi:integrase